MQYDFAFVAYSKFLPIPDAEINALFSFISYAVIQNANEFKIRLMIRRMTN